MLSEVMSKVECVN